MGQLVKNPPAMWETWVRSLGGEDPGEGKGYPPQYSGLENSKDCVVHAVAPVVTRCGLHIAIVPLCSIVALPTSIAGTRSPRVFCSCHRPQTLLVNWPPPTHELGPELTLLKPVSVAV